MMSLWDALRMNMMISYQELVRTFLRAIVTHLKKIKINQLSLSWHFLYFIILRIRHEYSLTAINLIYSLTGPPP
ncbi:hypothetical protein CI612_02110 [Klebsiella quasipneumoniae subsp. similipneumoniae]|nr:hypothetical protein CI612_02110 [Klebsiella quasipneumoniae subsp. similipneumoniae]